MGNNEPLARLPEAAVAALPTVPCLEPPKGARASRGDALLIVEIRPERLFTIDQPGFADYR